MKIKKINLLIALSAIVSYVALPIQNLNSKDAFAEQANTDSSKQQSKLEIIIENKVQYQEQHEDLISFIDSNFEEMINAYNEKQENNFEAIEIEDTLIVYVIGENIYATYIDFNDNNGYMVVTPDFQLYDFKTEGDLSYLKNIEFAFFSLANGFKYYDKESDELFFYKTSQDEESIEEASAYNGQSEAGDGKIYDLAAYIADRYPDYVYDSSYKILNYEHIAQHDTSIYLRIADSLSEGNCTLNATYSVLNSWRKQGLCPLLPTTTIVYDAATREPNHAANLAKGWKINQNSLYSYTASRDRGDIVIDNIPQLYADIREIVYERDYGYDIEEGLYSGINKSRIKYIMTFTLSKYSYYPTITHVGDDFTLMEYYFTENGKAQMFIVNESSTYGNHAMACLGYNKYTYTSGWWIFSSTKTAYFMNVDDGHSYLQYNRGNSIWYDPNATSGSIEYIYVYDHLN